MSPELVHDRVVQGIEALPGNAAETVIIGKITGLFGTHGWLKVHSFTRPRANLFKYSQWWVGQSGQWQVFNLLEHKSHGSSLLASLSEVTEREHAIALLKATVAVPRTALQPTSVGEYYWVDLIGLVVTNQDGIELGRIKRLAEAGDHDVLVVQGVREYLIPFVMKLYVLDVDLAGRSVRVSWHIDD